MKEQKVFDFAYWLNDLYLVSFDSFTLLLQFLNIMIKFFIWLKFFHRQNLALFHYNSAAKEKKKKVTAWKITFFPSPNWTFCLQPNWFHFVSCGFLLFFDVTRALPKVSRVEWGAGDIVEKLEHHWRWEWHPEVLYPKYLPEASRLTRYPFESLSVIQISHYVSLTIHVDKKAKISGNYLWARPTNG